MDIQQWFTWDSILQAIGAATGIWSIYLISKAKIWGWWLSFPSILASLIIFYQSALYGEMLLQVVFAISGIQGIYNWQVLGKQKQVQKLHQLALRMYVPYLLLFGVLYVGIYYLLSQHTNSSTPHLDAIITALSLVAQLMLTRQIFDNWTLWIIVDVLSVALYWYKDITLYAWLYGVYLYLAGQGWYIWNRNLKAGKVIAQ